MDSWEEIKGWRKEQRTRLVGDRKAVSARQRAAWTAAIEERLADRLAKRLHDPGSRCVAFYWPMQGEPDLRPFVRRLIEGGAVAALPVVVARNQPLEFWRWDAGARMSRQEAWGIPVPAERSVVVPQTLLIPLIGFDEACHRLGNGGGYYDRTLAARHDEPCKVGVGFEHGRLATIHPQRHDVPMDLIVTETSAMLERGISRTAIR